tara:strand:- start:3098 stop:3334 length:237 start_codon:yes stop_codon:yes gene_type:complete
MITVYGKKECVLCTEAIKLLKVKSKDFIYKSVDVWSQEARDQLTANYDMITLPIIIDDNGLIGGLAQLEKRYKREKKQ